MHRRHALKLIAAAGAGTLTVGGASSSALFSGVVRDGPPSMENASWFLVTNEPRRDLSRLRDALGLRSLEPFRISAASIAPSGQDLTVLHAADPRATRVLDPSIARAGMDAVRDLTYRMRRRRSPGTMLLSVEPRLPAPRNEIAFEVDGRLIEAVPADGSWNRIEIEGRQGLTVFRLDGGCLSVTESSCRHELCRRFGARSGGRIICAPNRLVAHLPANPAGLSGITG
jgi:hypothetical protein